MTSRPEILFPLHRSLTTLEGIGPSIEKKMKGLLIDKPVDLLFTLPISFIQRKLVDTVSMYPSGKYVIVEVSILKHQPCLLYTSPSPRDGLLSRMPSSA